MGLGNAATPAGIEAAKRLSALGEPGLRALAMLLAIDNASLQLMPTTVITLRQAAGAANPADIWGPTLLVSGASTLIAAGLMKLAQGRRA
jgi:spore maturation protein A